MCGRYSVGVTAGELEEVFEAPLVRPVALPRWNVAPTQDAPVVVTAASGAREILPFRWGLIRRAASAGESRTINLRAESVARGAFRDAFVRRRCLIPADGFYEWAQQGEGKRPYWIHHGRAGLLALAGLWERWQPRAGKPVDGFAVLTTEPNGVVRPLHHRMPVVIAPEAWATWLDPEASADAVRTLVAPAPDALLAAHAVSTLVNSVAIDDPRCVAPFAVDRSEPIDLFEGR